MRWHYNDGGRQAAGYLGSTGDCVTRAVAIATERPYQEIYDLVNQIGKNERLSKRYKTRGSARTGIKRPNVRRLLTSLGWQWTPFMHIGSGCRVHLRDGEVPMQGRIIASVSRHLCAVVDGVIHDTHDPSRDGNRCVYGIWQKAKP